MKLSQFTVFVPDFPSDGKYLVYNIFNQATAVIGGQAKRFLEDTRRKTQEIRPEIGDMRRETGGSLGSEVSDLKSQKGVLNLQSSQELSNFYDPSSPTLAKRGQKDDEVKYIKTFTDLGFLIEDPVDESTELKDWYNKARYNKSVMRATVLTTYNCNFACEYCVEEGVKRPLEMSEERCRAVVKWLINRVERHQSDNIQLQFYGGEPLMNVPPIGYIASQINDYSEANGIAFSFTITTNGSLLKSDLVDRLIPMGLEGIRVTLDGDRDAHNLKRPFKGGKGSFDVIVKNILQVVDRIKIGIGTNVDGENLESVPRMLDYLEQMGLKDKIDINFSPIVRIQDQEEEQEDREKGQRGVSPISSSLCPPASPWALDNLIGLKWDAFGRGFKTESKIQFTTICSMNLDGTAVVIDPLGRIYTCPAFVGREGFQVGDIYHPELSDKHQEFMSMEIPDDCFKCAYMPTCSGGCKHVAYTKYGDIDRIVCERDYLQKVTEELLKMHVLSQRGANSG